jgi:molybdopterin/thiamine biosynthesis adenylyltransferase/rhodanese-related sulfurtransferase
MDVKRFSRQIILEEFGIEGQLLLQNSKVLIIGLGGLGSPAAIYLTIAGVGTIGLFDFDRVDMSNLQRQPLYTENDVGQYKVEVAKKRLEEFNKNIYINIYKDYFNLSYKEILKDYDLILDCSDNIPTRKMLNQACLETGKPFLYCSIDQFTAQIALLNYDNGPCFDCLYPNIENSSLAGCLDRGVLGPVAGIAGIYQALEAIKFLSNMDFLKDHLLYIDLLQHKMLKLKIQKSSECHCNHYYNSSRKKISAKDFDVPSITKEKIHQLKDFVVLDIRGYDNNSDIYDKLSLSTNRVYKIDLKELPFRADILPKSNVVIVCSSGSRARQAAILLKQLSFSNVYYLLWDEFLE